MVQLLRQVGRYSVNWHGRDDSGRAVAMGIYLYRLKSSTYDETKKLLLLR
jgi:hypothetical protein